MATENRLRLISTAFITVPEDRQRTKIPDGYIEELRDSFLKPAGLLHPVILRPNGTDKYILVAGECRLLAWKKLEALPGFGVTYKKGIPARLITDLSEDELFDVEFEENYRRNSLSWQDEALAFAEHYVRAQTRYDVERAEALEDGDDVGDWSEELTFAEPAGALSVSTRHYRRMVVVGRKVYEEDKEVLACDSSRAAGALLDRRMKRIAENELATFGETEESINAALEDLSGPTDNDLNGIEIELSSVDAPERIKYSVHNMSFETLIKGDDGTRKFNFVHCDFPYGKGLHESDLYKTGTKDLQFEDTPDIYWGLCENLIQAKDAGVLSNSCHIMFWFPMNFYSKTVEYFNDYGFRVEPYPLVWIKSDKMGIIPDPTRGPRRIYETALIMSLGDRKIIKPTVNGNWSDSGRRADALHVSSKPSEMLRDFTRMFIDSDSVVLDPTCGSGTLLEVALLQHCKFVVGLDISNECVEHSEQRAKAAQDLLLRGA